MQAKWVLWTVGVLVVLALCADTVYRAGPKQRTDLPVYLAGSQRLLAGQDPLLAESSRGWPYVYPPTLAVALTPLTALPLRVAAGLWCLICLAVGAGGWWLWWRSRGSPPLSAWTEGVPLALVALPAISATLRGQVGVLLLGLLLAAAACLRRGRAARAGVLLALASAIKLTPGLILVGLVLARRWRALAGALAGLVLFLALLPLPFLGAGGTAEALEHFGQHMIVRPLRNPGEQNLTSQNVHVANNQSLTSQALRHLEGAPRSLALLLLASGVLGLSLFAAARAPRAGAEGESEEVAPAHPEADATDNTKTHARDAGEADALDAGAPAAQAADAAEADASDAAKATDAEVDRAPATEVSLDASRHERLDVALALLIAAPLLIAPIAWHHHHVLLFPALACLAARRSRSARAALGLFALLSLAHFAIKPLRPFGLLGVGTLLVFVATARQALPGPRPRPSASHPS